MLKQVIPSTTTSFDIICLENQEELFLRLNTKVHVQKGRASGRVYYSDPNDLGKIGKYFPSRPFSEFHKLHGFYLVDDMLNLLPGFLVDFFIDKLLTKMSSDPSHSSFLDLKWTTRCLYFLTYLGMINGEVTQKNMQNMTLGSFSAVCKWLVNQVFV